MSNKPQQSLVNTLRQRFNAMVRRPLSWTMIDRLESLNDAEADNDEAAKPEDVDAEERSDSGVRQQDVS